MGAFRYDQAIIERFPGVCGGVVHATGLVNPPSSPELVDLYQEEQRTVLETIGETPLSDVPALAAWRRVFSGFGVKPTQYRSAVEALLRRLTKQGDIPSINTLVDMANLISIRHRLPVAVFDQSAITGDTTVRFADGTEAFTDLGSDTITRPEPGEVVFVDDSGLVSARRWCWRQSTQSAAGVSTSDAVITIEGHHAGAGTDVAAALNDMFGLLDRFQPASSRTWSVLGPDQTAHLF